MVTSEKKIASNRLNAQKSTGPKTDEGKESMKHNAVTYGVYTQDALIGRGDGKEDAAELEALTREYVESYEPVGPIEHALVMTLVTNQWRQRRIQRAEVGEARRNLDSFRQDREWREADRVDEAIAALDGTSAPDPYPVAGSHRASVIKHRNTLLRNAAGVRYLIDVLHDTRRDIAQSRPLAVRTVSLIQSTFRERAEELCLEIGWCEVIGGFEAFDEHESEDQLPAEITDLEQRRSRMLRLLQRELRSLRAELRGLEEREELQGEAQRARFAIPDEKMAEQLSRAERSLENQRYRALEALERLQEQRRDRTP
jgi:hypothetical protein